MDTKFGRGPNGRALKKDGTERKARRNLSPAEKARQIREMTQKANATIGKKVLADADGISEFSEGLAIFRKWVSDCKAVGTPEKRAAKRAYYEAQIAALEDKGAAAEAFLPKAEAAIEAIESLHTKIGEAYLSLMDEGNVTPEAVSEIIQSVISEDIKAVVESANDPENDPLRNFRRGSDSESEDSDTL